jgi:hypothetical protein
MRDASFGAALLEGFEGTLDEVIGGVASPELRADLDVLQTRINALRVSIEPEEAELPPTTNNRRLVATLRPVF